MVIDDGRDTVNIHHRACFCHQLVQRMQVLVQDLNSDMSKGLYGTACGIGTSRSHLWVDKLPRKMLDDLLTVREHSYSLNLNR